MYSGLDGSGGPRRRLVTDTQFYKKSWFTTNFAAKLAKASSDSERWRVRRERHRFLQEHATVIARRNFEIFDRNACPKRGGEPPRAPPEQFE